MLLVYCVVQRLLPVRSTRLQYASYVVIRPAVFENFLSLRTGNKDAVCAVATRSRTVGKMIRSLDGINIHAGSCPMAY